MKEFKMPSLGEGVKSAAIIDIFVKPNDNIKEDDLLLEVETDKATVEIPANFEGTIKEVFVRSADVVEIGEKIFTYE